MSDITLYKSFQEWCDKNPSFDLDARLHTHGGPIEHGGYISDDKTRVAFAAYRAGKHGAETKDARIRELREALGDLIDTASRCDSWEYFPSDALEAAQAALRA